MKRVFKDEPVAEAWPKVFANLDGRGRQTKELGEKWSIELQALPTGVGALGELNLKEPKVIDADEKGIRLGVVDARGILKAKPLARKELPAKSRGDEIGKILNGVLFIRRSLRSRSPRTRMGIIRPR